MDYKNLPEEIKNFIEEEKPNDCTQEEFFEEGFEGVFKKLEDWAEYRGCTFEELMEEPEDNCPVYQTYKYFNDNYYCFLIC